MGLSWNPKMMEILGSVQDTINKVDRTLPRWEGKNTILENARHDYNELSVIYSSCETELANLRASQKQLTDFYKQLRIRKLLKIKDQINQTVNTWYGNSYDFRFFRTKSKGGIETSLKDLRRGGNLEHVCGGAVKQTVSVLFVAIFVKSSGGVFVFLDEAFNSLGVEEVEDLPDVLTNVTDLQIVLIEHKCTVIPDKFAAVISVERNLDQSSKITVDDISGQLEPVYEMFRMQETTAEDIEILERYGYTAEQIGSLVKINAEKTHTIIN